MWSNDSPRCRPREGRHPYTAARRRGRTAITETFVVMGPRLRGDDKTTTDMAEQLQQNYLVPILGCRNNLARPPACRRYRCKMGGALSKTIVQGRFSCVGKPRVDKPSS